MTAVLLLRERRPGLTRAGFGGGRYLPTNDEGNGGPRPHLGLVLGSEVHEYDSLGFLPYAVGNADSAASRPAHDPQRGLLVSLLV